MPKFKYLNEPVLIVNVNCLIVSEASQEWVLTQQLRSRCTSSMKSMKKNITNMTRTRFAPIWQLNTKVLQWLHWGNCTGTCPNISHITVILSLFKGFHYRTVFFLKQLSLFPGYTILCWQLKHNDYNNHSVIKTHYQKYFCSALKKYS